MFGIDPRAIQDKDGPAIPTDPPFMPPSEVA